MALLSFVDSAPRAYRLKVGNACLPNSTSTGTSPTKGAETDMFDLQPPRHISTLRARQHAADNRKTSRSYHFFHSHALQEQSRGYTRNLNMGTQGLRSLVMRIKSP
jgi:hypothetical protein